MSTEKPVLDDRDLASVTWRKIKAHLDSRIARHRAMNDNEQPELKTARLRGRIAEDNYILGLGVKDTPPESEEIETY